MIYLCNGFSESMKRDPNMKEIPYPLSEKEFVDLVRNSDFESIIGHQALSDVLTLMAGMDIPYNRKAIQVNYDDYVLLVTLNGRLPEHPRTVDYKGRLNFSFKRFEKQTSDDFANTISKIREIKGSA